MHSWLKTTCFTIPAHHRMSASHRTAFMEEDLNWMFCGNCFL